MKIKLKRTDFHPRHLVIGIYELDCLLDAKGNPVVLYSNKKYLTLLSLLEDAPNIGHAGPLKNLAYLVHFFCGLKEYLFIEDVAKFKEDYLHTIEYEKNTLEYLPERLIDHGVFDLSEMQSPFIEHHDLIYYVQNKEILLPHKAFCPYPLPQSNFQIRYQLLPYALP